MSKVLQERGIGRLPDSTEPNPRDHVKSISTGKADSTGILPFPNRLHGYCCDWMEAHEVKILETYDHTLPQKEKDPGSFTLLCFIHNVCFDKALVDLGASVSVMPFSTYTNLGLDFIILDKLEDNDVPLILGRPFLSTAHTKIDVFKRKITLRIEEEKLIFKSIKPTTSLIRRVYMLKEGTNLDSKTKLIGEAANESFDPHYSFTIIDDMDETSGVVLGMPFYKKFVSCQKIMEKFSRRVECERSNEE
ncbi:hypothetical protein Tco_1373274 [Tanacetum coccineum]